MITVANVISLLISRTTQQWSQQTNVYGVGGDRQTAAVVVAPSDEKGARLQGHEWDSQSLFAPLFTKFAGWRRALPASPDYSH